LQAAQAGAEALARQVAKLEKELAAERARVAALEGQDTEAAKRERQLKGLRTQVQNYSAKLHVLMGRLEEKTLYISKAKQRAIRAGLHPDNVTEPGAKKRLEAAFKAWESLPVKVDEERR
jgi:predicted  nucleic acid-binding Zn-ribbon protein